MQIKKHKSFKRIIRKGGLICLALIMMLSSQVALASSVPSDMNDIPETPGMSLDYAKNGIVRIQAGTDSDPKKTTCSGFIASDVTGNVFIVTTMHAVDFGENRSVRVVVKNDTTVEASVQSENREKDFCILSVDNKFNDKNAVPLRAPAYDSEDNALSAGEKVSALGFAKSGGSTEFSAKDVTVQKGNLVNTAGDNSGYIKHDIGVSKEMDGGVLVDEDGYAIGLINTKTGGALDITEVDTLLDKENMLHRTKDKDLMYKELYDLCAGVEDIYKKSTKETKTEIGRVRGNALQVLEGGPFDREVLRTALTDYKEVVDNAKFKTPKALFVVIALGLTIIYLAFKLWRLISWNKAHTKAPASNSRGSAHKAAAVQSMPKNSRGSKRKARKNQPAGAQLVLLRSGATYDIGGGRFTMGRSEESDLVIRGSNKVGRNHAFIERRPDAFYLFDNGSKNGTFINNMRADSDGIRLISGDIINLAGEEIQFIQK